MDAIVPGTETLPPGAAVRANLRGPSFPGAFAISTAPGEPLFLPPLSQPGVHFLEDIRLEVEPGLSVPATPATVTINVLDELLVGEVTSRPLSLEEIEALGIQFDPDSFQAFMFTIALMTESGVVEIDLPVLVPMAGGGIADMMIGAQIPGLDLAQLPGLELPNLGLEPIMLEVIEELPPGVEIPPIPGIVVIPGNIAFLNQFFSVLLTVSNQAPDGTPLVVRDLRAEIRLPSGADGVAGDILRDPPFSPGDPEFDNPLRLAETGEGRKKVVPVLAPGRDGLAGTDDDVDRLRPQGSGTAEFLVEGVREGGHVVEIEMRGTLTGLPGGPVEVAGLARGAVVVRDPDFSLTFIHPDVVRAGEAYELAVQVRNTSRVDANLVKVSLDAANLSGARLIDPGDAMQTFDSIPAGQSATATFRLEARRTGQVTASSLELVGEAGIVSGRRLAFRTGVSEQGVPQSPDSLILPPIVELLRERAGNDDLTFRALALLGEAHSIATAPRGSLPPGVRPISSRTVIQRARELTEAARRLELSVRAGGVGKAEPLPEGLLLTLQDLVFDWLGAGTFDRGWDGLARDSRQARLFYKALAEVTAREALALGLSDLIAMQRRWADTESYRAGHVTIATQGAGGVVPVVLELSDARGRRLGGALKPRRVTREVPGADVIRFRATDLGNGQLALATRTNNAPYTATFTARQAGSFDLGIVALGDDGELTQVVFRGLAVASGEVLTATIRPGRVTPVKLQSGGTDVAPTAEDLVPDGPPEVLGIVQNADPAVGPFGRIVGLLFDEDLDPAAAEDPAAYGVGDVDIAMIPPPDLSDGNQVLDARRQFGDRIVLIALRDPVGPFVPRTLDVAGIADLRGQIMDPVAARPILPDPDIGPGARLTGRVLRADGTPVAAAEISYLQSAETRLGVCVRRIITAKPADGNGGYALDYVAQQACGRAPFQIRARDPATGEEGTLTTRVRADGERLSLDIVLLGRGVVEGAVRDSSGTPLADVNIEVTSETDLSSRTTRTDQNGDYRIGGIPVGAFGVEARGPPGSARAAGDIPASGAVSRVDLTIFSLAEGVVTGQVRFPDGTGAPDLEVFLAREETAIGGVFGPAFLSGTTTDAAGTFRFEGLSPGAYLVRALEPAAGFLGEARLTVTAANTADDPAFVLVLLAGTGSVAGTVFERAGADRVPVPGALVAGGTQIVTTDDQGRYLIPAVPVGRRSISAVNPETGARGGREVAILAAGQASEGIDIVLQPLAAVTGRVLDPEGQPVAGQEVRILIDTFPGFPERTFVIRRTDSDSAGTYRFDQLEPRAYTLMALRGREAANGTVRLSSIVLEDVVDLRLVRPEGRVSGRVLDDSGLAVAAQVAIKARVPNAAGVLEFDDAATTLSDPDLGFAFDGLFPGPFTVTASSFFSPGSATASGVLPESNPVADVTLVLTRNTGTLSGCVLDPEGAVVEPVLDPSGVPLPLTVRITSRVLPDGIEVDASDGCYVSSIPLPPDFYTIQVTDDRAGSSTEGLTGQATTSVAQGVDAEQDVRLLGLGSLGVEVVDTLGATLPGVEVTLRRTTYPNDLREVLLAEPTDVTPLRFDGVTEGPVSVSAVVSSDPGVNVGGREELRGSGGQATAEVVRNGLQVVQVTIDAAGIVQGLFLGPDGVTPVANGQIELTDADRLMAFDVTGAEGAFRFEGIPLGRFTLEGFDPATGRRARAEARVERDGEEVIRDLELGPIGTVRGVVLGAAMSEPVAGAEVRLGLGGATANPREVTAQLDGSFEFPSVPGGPITVTATAPNGLSGRSEATLEFEGQELELDVVLEGSGRVEGTVLDAGAGAVGAAEVALIDAIGRRRTVQSGASGAFAFDNVPLGSFTLEARPQGALTPGDGGRAEDEITAVGEVVSRDVMFQGTITVGAVVSGEIGPNPVNVQLDSAGIFGGRAAPSGEEAGVVIFEGIPRAPLSVSASQTTPTGTTVSANQMVIEADLPPPGSRLDLDLVLDEVASVPVVATDPDGLPVARARVTLLAGNLSTLALTDGDGMIDFLGIPLDVPLRLEAEASDGGRAVFVGSIDDDGIIRDPTGIALDVVDLVLDLAAPEIVAVTPLPGAAAVPSDTLIEIVLSEPMEAASLRSCSPGTTGQGPTLLVLESTGEAPQANNPADPCDDSNVVPVDVEVSPDGTEVTLVPRQALRGAIQHRVVVSAAAVDSGGTVIGGVRDLVGRSLAADFIWQFVTRDDLSPRVVTVSPADGATGVPGDNLVRVTFSEPVDPTSIDEDTLAVNGPVGAVAGERVLILGDTVVLFTPTDSAGVRATLENDATYSVTIGGVRDQAGNVQAAEDRVVVTFQTRDTVGPTIASVEVPDGARPDETLLVTARTTDNDVAAVEFFLDGVLVAVVTDPIAPGAYQATLEMPERTIAVSARAADITGNVGERSAEAVIELIPDDPPTVAIVAPGAGEIFAPGTTVRFSVEAQDDVAVVEVKGAASGVVARMETGTISPPDTPVSVEFDVPIPASGPEGSVTFVASASDSRGQVSPTATLSVVVRDDIDPEVSIEAPGADDVAVPGEVLEVRIRATDASGIAEISLEVPEVGFSGSKPVSPPASPVTESFNVPLPDPLDSDSITLLARATDRFGRIGSAQRVLGVVRNFDIDAVADRGLPMDPSVPSANTGQIIRILGENLTGGLFAVFVVADDDGTLDEARVPVSGVSPDGTSGQVEVPGQAVSDPVKLETSAGTAVPGTRSLQIVPTLDTISIPEGAEFVPGVVATVTGSGFFEGSTDLAFPGTADVPAGDVFGGNTTLTVEIPDAVVAGELRVLTDGGESNGFPILGAFGLVAEADEGAAVDPALPSANTEQNITVTGEQLSTSISAVFSAVDADGTPTSVPVPLSNVNPDRSQASVRVPPTTVTGLVRLQHAGGPPSLESALLQIVPTLASLSVSIDGVLRPGVVATLTGSGFRKAETFVEFPGAPSAFADVVSRDELDVTVPEDLTAGLIRIVTDGGSSRGLPVPGPFELSATADEGSAANPGEASANVGQRLTVTGNFLSSDVFAILSGTDDEGFSIVIEEALVNVSGDATRASVPVPARATTGILRLRHRDSVPEETSDFVQIVPTLASIQVPPGDVIGPGIVATMIGSGFEEGATEVDFSGVGRVPADDVFENGSALTVTIPGGFMPEGIVSVVTQGGTSPEFQTPGATEPSLVAYWPFNDGANPTADIAGGHDGEVLGATSISTDIAPVPGNVAALVFDSGGRVVASDPDAFSFGPNSSLTISLWLKQTSSRGVYHVLGKRSGCTSIWNYQLARDSRLVHFSTGSNLPSNLLFLGADFPFDVWNHVAITYDGAGSVKMYVNGVEAVSRDDFVLSGEIVDPLVIGSSGTCALSQTFPGILDEIKVFDGVLSPVAVAEIAGSNVDTDGDGLTDAQERILGTDPANPDTDVDGLSDGEEVALGTDPLNSDTDGDGRLDGQEVLVDGTDPVDPFDVREFIALSSGTAASGQAMPAVDRDGNIHVAWVDLRDGPEGEIYYKMLEPDGTPLIDDTRLTADPAASRRPAIAVDELGQVTIVWQDERLGTAEIFYSKLDPSRHAQDGSPASAETIALVSDALLSLNEGVTSSHPRLAIDSLDRTHVVWEDTDTGDVRYGQIEVDGAIALAERVIVQGDAGPARLHPTVATDSFDDVHIVTSAQLANVAPEIVYVMLDPDSGAPIIAPTRLTSDDAVASERPSVGVGPNDDLAIVFQDSRLGAAEVFLRRIEPARDDQNGGAADPASITTLDDTLLSTDDGRNSNFPSAAVDLVGALHLSYYDNVVPGSSSDLLFQITDPDGSPILDEVSVSEGPTAGSAFSTETPGFVALDGPSSHLAWTDTAGTEPRVVLLTLNPDDDRDGLSNALERRFGTDKTNGDTDGDGFSDSFEVANGLDPLDGDTDVDRDGLTNIDELARGTDPLNGDTDGDGVGDGEEVAAGSDPFDPGSLPFDPGATAGEAGSATFSLVNVVPPPVASIQREAVGATWSVLNPLPPPVADLTREAVGPTFSVENLAAP